MIARPTSHQDEHVADGDAAGATPTQWMSTHAIKTELLSLLKVLAPRKAWSKRAGVVEISDWTVHNLESTSPDRRVERALELARVMYDNERS
jgi:hypothetical protein